MTSLAEMVARNSRMVTETVVSNTYGDTVNQLAPDPNVEAEYARYIKAQEASNKANADGVSS